MRALRWVPSQQDSRSHLLNDTARHTLTVVARCGKRINADIDHSNAETGLYDMPCTRCTAFLVAELLHVLEVSEREAWEWLAEWRYG